MTAAERGDYEPPAAAEVVTRILWSADAWKRVRSAGLGRCAPDLGGQEPCARGVNGQPPTALNIDPLELRLRNVLREGSLSPTGQTLHSVVVRETLVQAAERFGWNGNGNQSEAVS